MHSSLEVLQYFLRLGLLGFGGPLALIASMHRDLIEKRKWMPAEQFSNCFALIKALPGPVAFMVAVNLGRHRAGFRGGIAAAFGLIAPSFLLMVLFAIFYDQLKGVGGAPSFLSGMQAAALGVILASLRGLAASHVRKPVFWVIALVSAGVIYLSAALEPILIIGSGALTVLLYQLQRRGGLPKFLANIRLSVVGAFGTFDLHRFLFGGVPFGAAEITSSLATLAQPTFLELAWSCFKSGAFIFGSGLAIVPLMENDFVQRLGWLTHREFLDALAFGQITPGPVVITATFIGFKALGFVGALVATCSIFFAAFFHMMTWFPRLSGHLIQLPWIGAFLTGAIAAVAGAIFSTALRLALLWGQAPIPYLLIIAALILALRTRLPVWAVIPLGGAVGWILAI